MKGTIIGIVLLGFGTGAGLCQIPQQPDSGPVQAELLANLDVRHLQNGKSFFVRVTLDWKGQECVLRKGAVVQGTVEVANPRLGKGESKLALSFHHAECSGKEMQPMSLVLASAAQPPTDWSLVPDSQYWTSMNFAKPLPAAGGTPGNPRNLGAPAPYSPTGTYYQAHMELGGVEHRFPFRPGMKAGDVLNIKGVKLDVGTGPNLSSILSSKTGDIFLPRFTQLLFVPASSASHASSVPLASLSVHSGDPAGMAVSAAIAAPAVPFNDIEVCAPPGCAVDLPVSAKELQGHKTSSIPLRPLGYTPRRNKPLAGFGDDESVVWLGPEQLLFTFNPHKLIRRGQALNFSSTARVIRAVLVDMTTHNVIRAVDWEITDARRYIWPLEGDRILVHVGNELRVYGAGLEMERSMPLGGPLLFVRTAPNGNLSAVATVRERHSPDLHAKLRSELDSEPQEDVDVAVLNKDFETIARATTVTGLMPPTLLNSGQVRLQAEPDGWYRLAMNTWESKRVPLARFHSVCMPEVTSSAPDLLFLLSCSSNDGHREYRVLRADGKVLLRGTSDLRDLGHEAMGNDRSGTFAVKIVRADHSILPTANFTSSDLDSAEVRVYRAEDGKRLLAIRVKEPIASHSGYALSPDGSQLAVLSGPDIELYPVPAQ